MLEKVTCFRPLSLCCCPGETWDGWVGMSDSTLCDPLQKIGESSLAARGRAISLSDA